MGTVRVGLIGDRSPDVLAHEAIPRALELAGTAVGVKVRWQWLSTAELEKRGPGVLRSLDAAWCVPGSPYESEAGAIAAIRFVREENKPFLGTCGGCQHALLEYARNVLGYGSAEHAETNPHAELALIAPLSCALVEVEGTIALDPDTVIHTIYGKDAIEEGYHCRFGLNPSLEHLFASSDLRITGRDANGEARSFELAGRRFYLLTQFQPERAALKGSAPELVTALLRSAADGR